MKSELMFCGVKHKITQFDAHCCEVLGTLTELPYRSLNNNKDFILDIKTHV